MRTKGPSRPLKRIAKKARLGHDSDPPPKVILLLHALHYHFTRQDHLAEAHEAVEAILKAWSAREDIEELKELLGLKTGAKRRKHRTAERERSMALYWLDRVLKMTDGTKAKEETADRFESDTRTVERALLAVLMSGDLIVLVDNIAAPVDSAALCAALTSQTYKDRILGESRTVSPPTCATWLFNGNNLEFVGDLTSRILLSTLDPQCEQPEAHAFRRLGRQTAAARPAGRKHPSGCAPSRGS